MQNTSRLFSGVGYYIFRSANSQKNNFRRNPADPKLASEYIFYSIGCDFIQWLFVIFKYIFQSLHWPQYSVHRSEIYTHCNWKRAPCHGLVGFCSSPQLPRWHHHGSGMVPTLWWVSDTKVDFSKNAFMLCIWLGLKCQVVIIWDSNPTEWQIFVSWVMQHIFSSILLFLTCCRFDRYWRF